MAKQTSESKLHKILRIGLLSIIGLMILGGLSYITIVRPLEVKHEKDNFLKAQASIEELYDKIVAKIGKPDQIKRENKCRYASQVYGRGFRSCSVNIFALYENKSLKNVNALLGKAVKVLGSKKTSGGGNSGLDDFVIAKYPYVSQYFDQDYEYTKGVSCGIRYRYPVYPSYSADAFKTHHHENLQLQLSCNGLAKAEHFPVKQN